MAIHSALPTDMGLHLWASWSCDDPDYAAEWEDSNPCEEVWYSFSGNGVGLGTLIWLADRRIQTVNDFSEDTKKIVQSAEAKVVTEILAEQPLISVKSSAAPKRSANSITLLRSASK